MRNWERQEIGTFNAFLVFNIADWIRIVTHNVKFTHFYGIPRFKVVEKTEGSIRGIFDKKNPGTEGINSREIPRSNTSAYCYGEVQ